ncbi:MAG: AmmeMemoRadiSam system protein B [Gammaproteobacteria bacterium]|nr:AmmeMemoRadiSam system protein B [Gammaproteobacteria bacterium]
MVDLDVRRPAVAGTFYPMEAGLLARQIDGFFARTPPGVERRPKALVVPHAGYIYSGPVAASAYRLLCEAAESIKRVVLLGPSHYVALTGMAVPGSRAFETPLGRIPLDLAGIQRVLTLAAVNLGDEAHRREHSLEVQLPFLQRCLGEFTLLPVVVGSCEPQQVAELIESEWGDQQTLLVISTDLSHYLAYERAREADRLTTGHILSLQADLRGDQACGCYALNGLLLAARRHAMEVATIDLRNSGDTAGPADRVVGYGAFALYET